MFIYQEYLTDPNVCQLIIDHFNQYPDKKRGYTAAGWDPTIKDSLDLAFDSGPILLYARQLQTVVENYKKLYPFCDQYSAWNMIQPPNIQYYQPGQAFHVWHTERSSNQQPESSRHLVFMTYLNTVIDGGETEWYFQKLKIQPRTGLTVLWPADWTHTHRGLPSTSQEKYIVTGWFNFVD